VVRGLHYQCGEAAQAKLVSVVKGRVLDVAVDLRRSSPTFGKYVVAELSEENKRQMFVPRGFAHGFAVLSEEALFQYRCDNYYAPTQERGIAWNDPELGIDWGIPTQEVILSEKDTRNPLLKDAIDLF
jgi:dTDP-4-dehydrorhamnose 3,5-epimerase